MRMYGTFDGFKNYRNLSSKFKWTNVADECGNELKGEFLSNNDEVFKEVKLKFGYRYMMECDMLVGNDITTIKTIRAVNKNPRCDIFRKFKDEFHIIKGKYEGKKDYDIPNGELTSYCIWLARNTNNEATIKNTLEILKRING